MRMHPTPWCLAVGMLLVAGCPSMDTLVDSGSGVDHGEGTGNGSGEDSGGTQNPGFVGVLTAQRITFSPPTQPHVAFFLSGVFLRSDPDRPTNPNRTVDQIDLCYITTSVGDITLGESIEFLDPGEPGNASVGDSTIDLVIPEAFPHYYQPDYAENRLVDLGFGAGAAVVFDFPGGEDIAAFSGSVDVPTDLVLLRPNLLEESYPYENGSAVEFEWETVESAGEAARDTTTNVWIDFLGTNGVTGPDGTSLTEDSRRVEILCVVEDMGSFTVPAEVMARLPDSEGFSVSVIRIRQTLLEVELTGGGTGIVQLEGQVVIAGTGTHR